MSVPPDLAEPAPTSNTSEPETLPEASLEHSFPNSRELAQLIQQRVWLHVRRRKAWLDSLPTRATQQDASEFFNDPDDPRLERQWQNNGEGRIWNEPIREIDMELSSAEKQFELTLDEVRLPADALVGDEDAGLLQLFAGLNPERVMTAAFAIGMGRYALSRAVE